MADFDGKVALVTGGGTRIGKATAVAFAIAAMGLVCPVVATADDTGTLTVRVSGLQSADGDLRFVIFDSKKTFLNQPIRAEILSIDSGGVTTWSVADLPYGTYAVLVHHDVDGSGKMERHWYGKPKEPTGTSNNPPARMGPPKWKKARFQLADPTLTIEITVK